MMQLENVISTPLRQRLSYQAMLLGGVCCLVSVLLLVGNLNTSDRIAQLVEQDTLRMFAEVLPESSYDNDPIKETEIFAQVPGFTKPVTISKATLNNEFSGAVMQSSFNGWGGDVQFILAINQAGEITGMRIISHTETPGLGDKIEIEKSDWIKSFDGKSLQNTPHRQWAVKKDHGQFDQFTGATITPRAVVNAAHESLLFLQEWREQTLKKEADSKTGNL